MYPTIGGLDPYQNQYYPQPYDQQQTYTGGSSAAAAASGPNATAVASAGPNGAVALASTGGAQQADQTKLDPEARLEAAGEQFGQALQNLTPQQKADLKKLKQMVNQWAEQMKKQGKTVDKASMFAFVAMLYSMMGMMQNPGDQGLARLFGAGNNFIDATHNVVEMDKRRQGLF